jgi:hypothetical protein
MRPGWYIAPRESERQRSHLLSSGDWARDSLHRVRKDMGSA